MFQRFFKSFITRSAKCPSKFFGVENKAQVSIIFFGVTYLSKDFTLFLNPNLLQQQIYNRDEAIFCGGLFFKDQQKILSLYKMERLTPREEPNSHSYTSLASNEGYP